MESLGLSFPVDPNATYLESKDVRDTACSQVFRMFGVYFVAVTVKFTGIELCTKIWYKISFHCEPFYLFAQATSSTLCFKDVYTLPLLTSQ